MPWETAVAKKAPDERSAKETERIASEAIRVMLMTPHTPQRDLVGKLGRKAAKRQPKRKKARLR